MDVDDDLRRADEVRVEQRQPLAVVRRLLRDFLEQQRLAEDRRRFGERHRQPALQRGATRERDVVVGVPELVRECRDGVVTAVEVHHHAADVVRDRRAVRAAPLAIAHLGVDPVLVEGARRERGQIG